MEIIFIKDSHSAHKLHGYRINEETGVWEYNQFIINVPNDGAAKKITQATPEIPFYKDWVPAAEIGYQEHFAAAKKQHERSKPESWIGEWGSVFRNQNDREAVVIGATEKDMLVAYQMPHGSIYLNEISLGEWSGGYKAISHKNAPKRWKEAVELFKKELADGMYFEPVQDCWSRFGAGYQREPLRAL